MRISDWSSDVCSSDLLAWADRIVCSADSVNLVSEACATRAPVFVFEPGRVTGRPRRSLDDLLAHGRIRAMDAKLAAFAVQPLRETARVRDEIHGGPWVGVRPPTPPVRALPGCWG